MIRFYIDGTTGQKDGTEVTSINPITATTLVHWWHYRSSGR